MVKRKIRHDNHFSCGVLRPGHTRGHVMGICIAEKLLSVHCIGRMLQGQYASAAHTKGHVAGTCSGDMLQRQFSSCDIHVFAKKFCCGDRIMTYGIAHGAFLLVLAIL